MDVVRARDVDLGQGHWRVRRRLKILKVKYESQNINVKGSNRSKHEPMVHGARQHGVGRKQTILEPLIKQL